MRITTSQANVLHALAQPGAPNLRHIKGWASMWEGARPARSISPTVVALLKKNLVDWIGDEFSFGQSEYHGRVVLTASGRKWVQEHPR